MPGPAGQVTRATVWFDGAPVTILPKRAPVGSSEPIRGRTLAVFPDVPSGPPPPELRVAHTATVEPGGRPARAVLDLTEAQARRTGAALGLESVLFWDGRRAQLLDCQT
ncbi:MAG: hypothetical protein U0893_16915 [Chloroflexota bacterium]